MNVLKGLEHLPEFKNPVITIGTFDGVHLGHRKIIERLHKRALEVQGQSIVITFEPHPRLVLENQNKSIELLTTIDEKIQALETLPLDYVVIVPFTKAFSEMTAMAYIEEFIVNNFHPHTFVIGYDHHFGKNRTGNFNLLNEVKSKYGFELEEIPAQELHDIAVSSTKIREALLVGNCNTASDYLCRHYSLQGPVVRGEQRGRTIGFPTANIEVRDKHKLIPALGVYAVHVFVGNEIYNGMLNIGVRPTITNLNRVSIEAHIFDFNQDIYGQEIKIEFVNRLRDEQKFDSFQDLVAQLHEDKKNALRMLN